MSNRRSGRRPKVERSERVKPPPEAAQHHRPWPMMVLLHQGPEANGIDSDEFEAGIEIVETFRALTAELQLHGTQGAQLRGLVGGDLAGSHRLSDRAAVMANVWFAWCAEVGPAATLLVEQIEDQHPIRSVEMLRAGLRRWLKIKRDVLRSLDSTQQPMTLTKPIERSFANGDRGAIPISYPSPPIRQVSSPVASARSAAPSPARHAAPISRGAWIRR